VERANGDITLYVTPEIVKIQTCMLKSYSKALLQAAAVITGRQEDPGEAPWKRLKWNCQQSMVLVRMTRRERFSNTGV